MTVSTDEAVFDAATGRALARDLLLLARLHDREADAPLIEAEAVAFVERLAGAGPA